MQDVVKNKSTEKLRRSLSQEESDYSAHSVKLSFPPRHVSFLMKVVQKILTKDSATHNHTHPTRERGAVGLRIQIILVPKVFINKYSHL